MHNSKSCLENEMHRFLWDSKIQTDHLISARQPNLIIIKREPETCPADHKVKLKESEKKDKYLDDAWELKKL